MIAQIKALPFQSFLKILKKLFFKKVSYAGQGRRPCRVHLRPGKKKRKIGNAVTNFWLVFSAKKLTSYVYNTAIVYLLKNQPNF